MSLRNLATAMSAAAILAIGCDTTHFDSPDPEVAPARQETQPAVGDQHYISPDDALPRPESPRQPEYPVTPPAETQATDAAPQEPAPAAQDSTVADEPAVREVPADPLAPDQN